MSEADELLLKQDYIKKNENEFEIEYENNTKIMGKSFNYILCFAKKAKLFFHEDKDGNPIGIDMKLLEAITIKCVELRLDRRRK